MIFQNNNTRAYIPTYHAIEYNFLDEISNEAYSSMEDEDEMPIYECHCGQSYFNQDNYITHQLNKHSMRCSETLSQKRTEPEIKTKVNPILPLKVQSRFFEKKKRTKDSSSIGVDLPLAIEQAYDFVFVKHKELCYFDPKKIEDNNLLLLLSEYKPIQETKGSRKIDEVLYEYCLSVKYLTNTKYFTLVLENLLILREFCNKRHFDPDYTKSNMIGDLPLFCNDLIEKYLLNYGFKHSTYKESIKIIHNIFNWFYYNEYSEYVIKINPQGNFLLDRSD